MFQQQYPLKLEQIMKTFIIKQMHTFEYYYEIEADSKEDALFKLQAEAHEPILEEFHSMNGRQDWEVSLDIKG